MASETPLFLGIGTGNDESPARRVAVAVGNRHFVRIRRRLAASTGYFDDIATRRSQAHGREIRNDVGGQIRGRVADLVKKLFGNRLNIDGAAGACRLFDAEAAIVGHVSDRIADVGQVRLILPIAP